MLLVGSWAELEDLYQQDYGQALKAGLKDIQARLLMEQGELEGWRNRHRRAGELLELADRTYRELNDAVGRFRCENGLAVVYINLGEYEKAEAIIDEATARARGQGLRPALCSLLNSHAVLCRERRESERAIAYLEERMEISREMGGVAEVASSHMNMAVLFAENGRHELALEHNRAAIELSGKIGDILMQHYALFNQAHILRHLGRLEECLEYLRRSLAMSRHLGDEPATEAILRDIANVTKKSEREKGIL